MSQDRRKLLRQNIHEETPYRQDNPPPVGSTPDIVETLRLLEKISRMPDIRFEKVQKMQELIAENRFETPERIEGTVRRLMEELGL